MIVLDLETSVLSAEEKELLVHPNVAGIILFTRNYESPQQLLSLTTAIKKIRPNSIIAADQEGGRVQRFRDGFTTLPAMAHWGELYDQDPLSAKDQLHTITQIMIQELQASGVNVCLAPLLDINLGMNEVIGHRSFHSDPKVVSELGKVVIDTMHAKRMSAVGKHFPGHGGVSLDSHLTLPVDERDWQSLWDNDLKPFVNLSADLDAIMPAHIVYSSIDSKPPVFSRVWLQKVLRQELQFNGIIVSDDLSMGGAAAMGSYQDRAGQAYEAGCDLLLVCNNRQGVIEALDNFGKYHYRDPEQRLAVFLNKYINEENR